MRKFKFFVGISEPRLVANWNPNIANELITYDHVNAEQELTNLLSNEIANAVDQDIMQRLLTFVSENRRA